MKKAKKIGAGLLAAALALSSAIAFTPLPNWLAATLIVKPAPARADVIAVLGAGAYPNGELCEHGVKRVLQGIFLYREGFGKKIFFTGGFLIRPGSKLAHTVLGARAQALEKGVIEAEAMGGLASRLGIDDAALVMDGNALNTYENMKGLKAWMEANGFKDCVIVTSPTHMLRATLIAGKLGLKFHPAPFNDYTEYITSAGERLSLFREVMHEYAALALYRVYGYI